MTHDNKQLLFLSLISFFAQMIISMVNLALVYYLNDALNYSASTIAITVSSFSISYVVFCLLLEKPTSHLCPRQNIYFALVGMGISILLFLKSYSYIFILSTLVFYGGFMALLWPHMETWYSRGREGKHLNKAISYFNFSWSAGIAFSSIICGLLTEIDVKLPLIISVVSFILLSLIVFILTNKVPYLKAVESEKKYIINNKNNDNSTPLRYFAWIAVFLAYFFYGMLSNIFPLYAKNILLINETRIGFLLWSRGVVSCLAFYYLGKMSFWHFKGNYIILSQLVLAVLCLVTILCNDYYSFFIIFILFGLIFSLMYLQSIFHGVSGAVNRTRRMIIHEVLLTCGLVFGSIISGYIFEKFGFKSVMKNFGIFMFAIVFVEYIVFSISLKKPSKIEK